MPKPFSFFSIGIFVFLASLLILGIRIETHFVVMMIVFWSASLFADLGYTVQNRRFIKNEQSVVLNFFLPRVSFEIAILLSVLTEIALIVVFTAVASRGISLEYMGVFCTIAGIIHVHGFVSNRKFVKTHNTM